MLGFIYNRNGSICFLGFTVCRLEKPKQAWKSSKAEERNSGEAKKQKSREAKEQKSTKKRDGKNPIKKTTSSVFTIFYQAIRYSIDIPSLGNRSCGVEIYLKPPGHLDPQLDIRAGGHLKARSFQTPQLDWQPRRAV